MSETEEKYDYSAYGIEKSYIVKLLVAGGGLMNGNAYREIEIHYNNKEEWENCEEAQKIYFCEYGRNPIRKLLEYTNIEWGEDDNFNLY